MLRVCVCGGRHYIDRDKLYATLDKLLEIRKDFMIISGGATGADTLAIDWAKERNVPVEVHYASWGKFGRAAGPIRNKKMLDLGIDLLVAFPGGSGTKDMTDRCREKNIRICSVS